MTTKTETNTEIVLEEVQNISPHNKALYEAGKTLLIQSVEVGREFCKFMTTSALAAIPTYIALLKLILPNDYSLQSFNEVIFLLPPILFMISAVIFVLGYFPQKGQVSLDLPAEIDKERGKTITRRHRFARLGFIVFVVGVAVASWVLIGHLRE